MNLKWYYSALILVLSILGGSVYDKQQPSPNQFIVLQFQDQEIDCGFTEKTLKIVKERLNKVGIEAIEVTNLGDGTLTISYFSDKDIEDIKIYLNKVASLNYDLEPYNPDKQSSNIPKKNLSQVYDIAVYEISKIYDIDTPIEGALGAELKLHLQDSYSLDLSLSSLNNKNNTFSKTEGVAYKHFVKLALGIDFLQAAIPEVRAGPFC